jgi:hypothetical protein
MTPFAALAPGLSPPIAAQVTGASDPAGVIALCSAMTIALLVYVFYVHGKVAEAPDKTRLAFLRERKEAVYENLRDLNFEYKAGKFPETDYQQMRASLEDEAAALLAEIERLENGRLDSGGASAVAGVALPARPKPVSANRRRN